MFNIKKNIYSSANSRDFYKGKSFEFTGNWKEGIHYFCDDYKVSFITKNGVLLACIKSHKSNEDSEPKIQYNSETHIPEITSDYWTIVVYGLPGVNIANIYFDYPNLVVTLSNGQTISIDLGTDLKADKVTDATDGNFAGLSADGNLTDSGKKASDFSTATNIENGSGTNSIQVKGCTASGNYSHAEGYLTKAEGERSHAEGSGTGASGNNSHAEGFYTTALNRGEHAEGTYNKSNKASGTFGNAGNTQHSIGIGTSNSDRKNAFEVRQNGDIYIDRIGNYNGSDTASTLQTVVNGKQDILTFDDVPTANSNNPVKSQGIKSYIDNELSAKENKSNKTNTITSQSTNVQYPSAKTVYDQVVSKIPNQTYLQDNELADKAFVNSSIQTETATFRGNWNTWGNLPEDDQWGYVGDYPDNNDYIVVVDSSGFSELWRQEYLYFEGNIIALSNNGIYSLYKCIYEGSEGLISTVPPDEDTGNWESVSSNPEYEGTWRFKYVPSQDGQYHNSNWYPEYKINDKPLTAAQIAAINSGIISEDVTKLSGIAEGAQVNTIEGIKIGSTSISPDTNKIVDLQTAILGMSITSNGITKTLQEWIDVITTITIIN